MRVIVLTLLAMIAFASNSLLCRAALKQTTIDPATFTFVKAPENHCCLDGAEEKQRASSSGKIDICERKARGVNEKRKGGWPSAIPE